MYKLLYVPADFKLHNDQTSSSSSLIERIENVLVKSNSNKAKNTQNSEVQRACFTVKGSVGNTIRPQTVLPDLTDYTYDSTANCPHSSSQHRHAKCELWKHTTAQGDKRNTYKMWIRRDTKTGTPIPVLFYMLGYDSLLGSHYDRYDITYYDYQVNAAQDTDFLFQSPELECGSMPGPGNDSASGERRSHMIVQNPIHEYVEEPHRYDHVDHEFSKFVDTHDKSYPTDEHHRKGWFNFLHNFRFINGKNRELKQYKLSVNKFADKSGEELRYMRGRLHSTGYNGGLDYAQHHKLKGANGELAVDLPDTWDWSIRGAVTPVKDQAVCGSCWSFGTSGTLEGAYFVKTGKLPRLSQQQMVDCSWKFGNNGCDGGEDFRAYQYIMEAGGLSTEEDYGNYLGVDGMCHDKKVEKTVKIKGFYNVTAGDPEALKHAVTTYGPVTIAIDASRPTFTFYSHGVYYDDECNNSPNGLDHQVLVVGYVKIDGQLAWIVKNSWSTHWGNNGYILMSAKNNNCGVMDAPTVPIIDA